MQRDEVDILSERYSLTEEVVHCVTHGVGAVLSVGALITMIALSITREAAVLYGCIVYGGTLAMMYATSTVYHAVPFRMRRAKRMLQVADQCAIFALIAGTYTPLTLVTLRGSFGLSLLVVVWFLAILGVALRTLRAKHFRTGPTLLYVAMGWLAILAIRPLIHALPPAGVALLLGGGIAYTGGIGFYVWHRLRYHHAIWHGFVLLGSILHFLVVLAYVIPAGAVVH
jgi:hemolysin III